MRFFPFASLRVRMTEWWRFFTPLTLRSEWQNKRGAEAVLSRSPEPKPWAEALSFCEGSAKGLRRNDPFLCHPEGFSPKGLLRRFFGRLRSLRMTEKAQNDRKSSELLRWQNGPKLNFLSAILDLYQSFFDVVNLSFMKWKNNSHFLKFEFTSKKIK